MKKFLLLLLGLPMLFAATSCDDDKDLPKVDISVDITGAITKDGTVYAVVGDTISVNNITIKNLDEGKPAGICAPVNFYWDGLWFTGGSTWTFPTLLTTAQLGVGEHILQLEMGVVADDKSPAFAVIAVPVVLVATPDDLPAGNPDEGGTIRDVIGTRGSLPGGK